MTKSSYHPTPSRILTQHAHWVDPSCFLQLEREPHHVWTMCGRSKEDAPPLPMQLKHRANAFLEDAIHDYVWVGMDVRLHRRTEIEKGVWVVVEYDDTPTAYVLDVVVDFDGTKAAIEVKSKDADPDLDGAIDFIVGFLKKKTRAKLPRSICGNVKVVRHGPGWHKDPWSYGTADQRADAMLKLRVKLHETFPGAKDGIAYDWDGKLVGEEWADVNAYTAKQKETVINGNAIGR